MDYYTTFGAVLDLKSAENVAAAIALYKKREADVEEGELDEQGEPLEEWRFQIQPGTDLAHETEVFIFSDDHGEPEHVASFVSECAQQFGLTGSWGLEYAFTASRPVPDSTGGGAFFINFDKPDEDVKWMTTSNWFAEQQASVKKA